MAKVLLVGCGDLGTAVAINLKRAGHEVIGVRKSAQRLPLGMQTLQADVTDISTLEVLSMLRADIVIYCVAATAANDENYYQHYVLGLKNILVTQRANTQLKHVFFVSSTRVYGHSNSEWLSDHSQVKPMDFGGQRLYEAEQLLSNLSCGTTALRLSGIYGQGRHYLLNMAQNLTRWPVQNHWTNRIHRDDAAEFVAYLVNRCLTGLLLQSHYIVTDHQPCPIYEVLMWMADKMGKDVGSILVPQAAGGKRLNNEGMLSAGFKLNYPSYREGYATLLAR